MVAPLAGLLLSAYFEIYRSAARLPCPFLLMCFVAAARPSAWACSLFHRVALSDLSVFLQAWLPFFWISSGSVSFALLAPLPPALPCVLCRLWSFPTTAAPSLSANIFPLIELAGLFCWFFLLVGMFFSCVLLLNARFAALHARTTPLHARYRSCAIPLARPRIRRCYVCSLSPRPSFSVSPRFGG